jgi:hypothetical protein
MFFKTFKKGYKMMKFKTTNKALKQNGGKMYSAGYCQLQELLKYETPIAYTCGRDGWKADVYQFDGFMLATGYSLPPHAIRLDYKDVQELERKARKSAERGVSKAAVGSNAWILQEYIKDLGA